LERAAHADIVSSVIDSSLYTPDKFNTLLFKELCENSPDMIVLAGYMKILPTEIVKKFKGKIINIHPSLLPKYKGLNTHRRALESNELMHGATVHCVTDELDDGAIIGQYELSVNPNESEESLTERVHKAEHIILPMIINLLCSDQITINDNKPRITKISSISELPILISE
jgi:phosphoribosylglycinamide formyltransferase-1